VNGTPCYRRSLQSWCRLSAPVRDPHQTVKVRLASGACGGEVRAKTRETISVAEARRAAVAAQGLARPRPAAVSARDIRRTVAELGLLQIDSVNVLVRAHYMPLFSRLGAYPHALLEADACHASPIGAPAPSRENRGM
jgi:hypothetical protein